MPRHNPAEARPTPGNVTPLAWMAVAAAILLVLFAIIVTWVGYVESDDAAYIDGARGWLTHVPYLGTSHWTLRHVIVLPLAAVFAAFGENEATLLLPSMAYTAALLALLGWLAWRGGGPVAAALAIALAGTAPVVAIGTTMVSTDTPEAFFVLGSFVLWWHARGAGRDEGRVGGRWTLFLLSGMAAGGAAITRETAIVLPVFYLGAFVLGGGRDFLGYLAMAAGGAAVVGIDWLYLYLMSGDPLYRIHVAQAGAANDGPQLEVAGENVSGVNRFGLVALPRLLRPLGAVLVSQSFGLLFWMAIPCAAWLALKGRDASARLATACLGLFACWVVVLGYALSPWLWVISRYYIVGVAVCVPAAVAVPRLYSRSRALAVGIVAAGLGANIALDLAGTRDLMGGEHEIVAIAASHPGLIHTDPSTAQGAAWLLARRTLEDRVSTDPPRPGDLYFFSSRPRRGIPEVWPIQHVPPGQACLGGTTYASRWTTPLVDVLHLGGVLPPGVRLKLQPPPLMTCLYVVPQPDVVRQPGVARQPGGPPT